MYSWRRQVLAKDMKKIILFIAAILIIYLVLLSAPARAIYKIYSYDKSSTVVGIAKTYRVHAGESLIEIARKFDLGYNEITDANPGLDPFVPGKGALVKIPTSWILPDIAAHDSIIINLSEFRLYYFFRERKSVKVTTFPIGLGDEGFDTPVGQFKVIKKIVAPTWYVPESIKKERPGQPSVVPPGPDNPLGSHALRLSLETILIHGTNKPWGVGRRSSHGCIRLYPEDIPRLYQLVPKGMKVTVVRQPVKVGVRKDKVYIEVHRDYQATNLNYFNEAVNLLMKRNLMGKVNTNRLARAVKKKQGMPVDITK